MKLRTEQLENILLVSSSGTQFKPKEGRYFYKYSTPFYKKALYMKKAPTNMNNFEISFFYNIDIFTITFTFLLNEKDVNQLMTNC